VTHLLIVDDDQFIREGLKRLIDWDELGITLLDEAEGGYEALEMMERQQPHILLTDIRMPRGDGLQLIEQVRLRNWSTFIVVLSGYNDYTYVRQAMKFQVEDYLLKPVDAAELKEIMLTCSERYRSQWIQEQLQRESFQLLRNNIFLRWAQNRINHEQLREKLKFLNMSLLRFDMYQAGVISWRNPREGELTPAEEQFRSFAILNIMEELLRETDRGIAFINEKRQIVVLLFENGSDPERFAARNREWMSEMAQQNGAILKASWLFTFGAVQMQPSLVYVSYKEALRLQNDKDNLSGFTYEASADSVKNPITQQVEHYLLEHYNEELSLQTLSSRFNVNNVYLGRLFKEETGEYFSDYLNRIRLDEAKKLLQTTLYKASDIAAIVGFLDPNYFYRKFKQVNGMSPSEYRSQNIKIQ
jgi:two-component system response regulator YesN